MACLTKDQADLLIREIEILENGLYKIDKDTPVRAETISEFEMRKATQPDVGRVLADWRVEIEKFQVLNLTVAYEPNLANLTKIWQWANVNLGSNVVLDIDCDFRLIAGAIVTWKGKYRDYSFQFDQAYERI